MQSEASLQSRFCRNTAIICSTRVYRLEQFVSHLLADASVESANIQRQLADCICTILTIFVARAKPMAQTNWDSS